MGRNLIVWSLHWVSDIISAFLISHGECYLFYWRCRMGIWCHSYCCSLQAAMLPSAEFICLRVAYREAFWEELSRLIWRGRSIRRPLLFSVHVIFFHSLQSWVGCSFQGKLFSIFKFLCLVFDRYYFSSCTALQNCVLLVIALRSLWENFFADTRFVLLMQAINLSRLS